MKLILIAALCAVASASSHYGYERPATYDAPAVYNFAWGVDDSESYVHTSHRESRNGDNTEGEYTVVEPDGSTRRVTYYVNGDGGFVADVNGVRWPQEAPASSGYAQPTYKAAPVYQAPAPKVYKPAPVAYKPAPKVYRPAPVYHAPAPVYHAPAPKVYKPAPVVYKPAPKVYKPAPVVYQAPAPAYPAPAPAYNKPATYQGAGASSVSIQTPSHSISY